VVSRAGVAEGGEGVEEEELDDELVQKYNTQALIQATRRIKKYGKERQPNLAIRTLADLADQGIQPDMIAATAAIDACVNSNKIELAENVFNELFGKGNLIEPDEVTYAVLIKGYGQDREQPKWSKIKQILQAMEVAGMPLTTCTYNTLLEVCAASNDWERGMQVLDQMADRQVAPDQMTLEIVKKRKILRAHLKKLF
jgi:pentatricopeptide repeat protein